MFTTENKENKNILEASKQKISFLRNTENLHILTKKSVNPLSLYYK